MTKRRIPTWLLLILVPVGLLLVAIPGIWVYAAKPIHPDAESVPTAMRSEPLEKWAGAAKQGRQMVRASVAGQNLPGVSVAVGMEGEIVWAEGFGFADLRSGTGVTPDDRFRIGTASEALTSAAAGLLIQDGRLKPDDEIQAYAPAFPRKQWPVTLRQLMGHTAGISTDGGDGRPLFTRHCERPGEALQYFAEKPLLFKPGTQYRYSSYGWILVSAAVEAAAEQPLFMFLRRRVFDPLGMRQTTSDSTTFEEGEDFPLVNMIRELVFDPEARRGTSPDSAKRPMRERVTSYFPRFASDPNYGLHVMRPLDYSCYAGSSGFVSTPSDLVRFGMAIHSGKLLQRTTVEMLQASQRLVNGEETGYGLGWYVKTVTLAGRQTRVTGHDGESLGGMVASLMTVPEYGMVVAVTSNISHADTSSIAVAIAEIFAKQGTARQSSGRRPI